MGSQRASPVGGLEWLAFSTKVLWITALMLVAMLTDRLSLSVLLLLLAWGALAATLFMARLRGLLMGSAALVPLLDTVLALVVIARSGFFGSPLWSALLVGAFEAGLMYGLAGAVILGMVGMIGAALIGHFLTGLGRWALPPLGLYVGAVMLAAGVMGQLADQLRERLRGPSPRSLVDRSLDEKEKLRLRAIFQMVAELNATLNYERVLDMALEVSANALSGFRPEADRLVGALLLYDGDQLRVVSGRRLTNADWRVTLPGEEGIIAGALERGDPCSLADPLADPEVRRLVGFHGCKDVICLPLMAGLEAYGVLLFGHPKGDYFQAEQVELLEAIAQQSMVALQNARLYRDLEQEKERIMQIEEEARRRLARELHDGPTQSIAALAMRLNFARRLMERDQKKASQELYKVEDLARRTTKEIRHMLFTLRPLILESRGLVPALQQFAEKVEETRGQRILVQAEDEIADFMDRAAHGPLFYIAEEAVNNACKHAEAQHIWVRLRRVGDDVVLEVEDDGVGFNIGAVDKDYAQSGSLGMVNMRERAELIGAVFEIQSQEGEGTLVRVRLPAQQPKPAKQGEQRTA
jgi:signal transduction histidine kinase